MSIPIDLKQLKQWVVCKADSKVPYSVYDQSNIGWNKSEKWATYEEAKAVVDDPTNDFTFLGFVLSEEDGIVGIDIDAGVDENGLLTEYACDVINSIGSYTEWSKHKRGVHIFVKGKLPFDTGVPAYNHQYAGEIYQAGKHLVMTGDTIIDEPIKENQEGIDYVLQTYYSEGFKAKGLFKEPFYKMEYQPPHDGTISLSPSYPDIIEGSRDLSLLSYGGQLIARGLSDKEIYKELLKLNNSKCKPPLDCKEVDSIYKRVLKYKNKGQSND